jgi:hypothetical protein
MENEFRSRHVVIAELQEQQAKIEAQYATATPEQKPTLLLDLNRVGQALSHARWEAQEVHTGKIVPSDGTLEKNNL